MSCKDSFWRLTLALNHHIDLNLSQVQSLGMTEGFGLLSLPQKQQELREPVGHIWNIEQPSLLDTRKSHSQSSYSHAFPMNIAIWVGYLPFLDKTHMSYHVGYTMLCH
jgi:hypothetical protein